jgi:site-specific DNA recombinase
MTNEPPMILGRNNIMRAVIYARYSSEHQREASIDDQIRICKERITREGWTFVQVFRDAALSGASALRPGYQALMEGGRNGAFDIVVAEALDRLSRDQEDIAAFYKRLRFAGIRVVTLSEGEISELHVGLKGTMNALFLKDLAAKVHRGLRGRVEAGHSGGGNAYGYRVVRRLDAGGQPVTGERQIDLAQAAVVRRVFRAYAAGESPKRIALKLNAEGVPAPRGGAWSSSSLNGNRVRGTGLLNNELYIGRLCWNRQMYVKDPETGRRRSRQRSADEQIVIEVPDLRIIDQAQWEAAKARQAALDRPLTVDTDESGEPAAVPFWSKQRARYLFSGLMRCGVCGGGFSKISQQHFGCSTARNKGPTVCTNLRAIRRDELEETVLGALRERLMDPALFKAFAASFTTEWNKLQGNTEAEQTARAGELQRVRQQIERLVDAIAEGTPAAAVRDRLASLEKRRLTLEADSATATAPAPRLHPNLAELYRRKVAGLIDALNQEDAGDARALVRSLVEAVTLHPDGDHQRVEVRGELATILALATGGSNAKSATESGALAVQMKMVAGTRNPPLPNTVPVAVSDRLPSALVASLLPTLLGPLSHLLRIQLRRRWTPDAGVFTEHKTFNLGAVGSSPTGLTNQFNDLPEIFRTEHDQNPARGNVLGNRSPGFVTLGEIAGRLPALDVACNRCDRRGPLRSVDGGGSRRVVDTGVPPDLWRLTARA